MLVVVAEASDAQMIAADICVVEVFMIQDFWCQMQNQENSKQIRSAPGGRAYNK